MENVNDLLVSWELAELKEILNKNEIKDTATLGELLSNRDELKEIVPSVGTRLKLRNKYNQYITTKCTTPNNCTIQKDQEDIPVFLTDNTLSFTPIGGFEPTDSYNLIESLDATLIPEALLDNSIGVYNNSCEIQFDNVANAETTRLSSSRAVASAGGEKRPYQHEAQDTNSAAKKSKYRNTLDANVKDILEQHPLGPSILMIYNHTQQLDTQCQSYVCDIIVLHFLKSGISTLTNEDFEQLAEKIVEVFPNECSETYYVPPVKKKDSRNSKSGISKGKLVDKYRNKTTFIRRAKNIAKKLLSEDTTDPEIKEELLTANKSRTWLLHNRNEKDVLQHWIASYSLRALDCKNDKYQNLTDIFDRWPILKEGKGHELIESDFRTKYPSGSEDLLIVGWETFFAKIFSLYGTKVAENNFLLTELLQSNDLSIAGIHKIRGLHFSIAAMPPKYSATLDNMFLAQLIYTSDYRTFKNEKCFQHIIEQLKFLFTKGISITVTDQTYQVYFVVIAILGDNLGVNSLFGFVESFSAQYFCRFCRATKTETHSPCVEDPNKLRNVDNYNRDNYNRDVETLSHGVKKKCVFNELPFFHNLINSICDIMHDLYLGVCRYVMARIIGNFIKKGYFSLLHLNDRLKYFDYSHLDHGNKISSISEKHIRNGCIIITAAEMSALIAYFGIIIGDLIPEDNSVWELYLFLFEIIDIVTSSCVSEYDISHLEQLIKSHNQLFMEVFHEDLKPKFHFLIHYANIFRKMGPLKFASCTRFEAFHKQSKAYANIVSSRRNIIFSIAQKLQLQLTSRFLSKQGIDDSIEFGRIIGDLSENVEYATLPITNIDSPCFELTWIKANGLTYKPKAAIHVKNNANNDPVIGPR